MNEQLYVMVGGAHDGELTDPLGDHVTTYASDYIKTNLYTGADGKNISLFRYHKMSLKDTIEALVHTYHDR